MASVTNAEIKVKIKTILQDADLSTLSAKKVRKKLEEIFDTDFTERKKEVDAMTMELLTEQIEAAEKAKANGREDEEEEEDKEDEKEDDISSDEDQPDPSPPKKKVKTEKKPVKKSASLSSEPNEDEEEEEDDAEVAKRLQEEETFRRPSRAVAKKPAKKRKERQKKEKGAGGTCYSRPCYLSEDLADIMGTSQMARNEIVKKMWEIVRERNLQDPKNKQWMICDEQLMKVFGKKKVKTFGMMKYLKNHIKDVQDVS